MNSVAILHAASTITQALAPTINTSTGGLAWDADMQRKAALALYNGGSADAPCSRRGITEWREHTNKTRWEFDRMRFASLTPLAAGWIHTRNDQYTLAARDYIEDWMDTHPRPDDDDRLNIAIRVNQDGPTGWLGTLPYFIGCAVFDEAFIDRMITLIRRDLNWMQESLASTANVRLFQANALLWAGLRLPHIPESASWKKMGTRMLNDAFNRMFSPDGSNIEKDPHYVGVYTEIFGQVPLWAKAFPELGLHVSIDPISRMFDYALCGTKPNGYEVGMHDSVSSWHGQRDNYALATRQEFRERNGLPDIPPPTFAIFPNAGQAFLRTSWDANAHMVTIDATREPSAHNHLGVNSVQFHAHGRTHLMDPGFLTYRMGHLGGSATDNLAGPYGKSTRAHNTLNLNGWNQWMISPEWLRSWNGPGYDATACRYAGGYWPGAYGWWFFEGGGHGIAATHDRVMLWIHDRAVIIIDFLMRWDEKKHGGQPHQQPSLEMNWQFCPGTVTVDHATRQVHTNDATSNILMLFPVAPEGTELAIHEGETAPFRGWIGDHARDHCYLPAPQLSLTASPMKDYYGHFVSVIIPYQGTEVPQVVAAATPTSGPGSTKPGRLSLRWADGTVDEVWWMHALEGAIMAAADFETDASVVHRRTDANGHLLRAAAINGTFCEPLISERLTQPGVLRHQSL